MDMSLDRKISTDNKFNNSVNNNGWTEIEEEISIRTEPKVVKLSASWPDN